MQYPLSHNHPAEKRRRGERNMFYTASPTEVGYTAATDQQFVDPTTWWQPASTPEHPNAVFTGTVIPQYIPITKPPNDLAFGHVKYSASVPLDTRSFNRRHTVHVPQIIERSYGPQYDIDLAASFPTYMLADQSYPSNFESGLMSPPSTTPSSRPSIASLNSYSPTAPNICINQNNYNTQGFPMSTSEFPAGKYPYSPAISDISPTQSQLTQPPQIHQLEGPYDPESERIDKPLAETTFCYAEGCDSKFTGEYQKGNLKRHLKSNHPELLVKNGESPGDPEKLRCSCCPQLFKRSDARKKHEYRTHKVGPEPLRKPRYAPL
ncbi:hypothetical protein P171DRAFT_232175 [Karstenula rhodostoma CBS 690.94]|uniref:C2H2-type domain-containing protein n=1 Tax=Karstenula rhodostoma CBS 690.94 TaxID=1392251 RepID=A0A9P4UDG4_9PLEO|nr:hypothetical protein P171DRAFT_232175 [Karstenula rhodostoma CBS 690.94]